MLSVFVGTKTLGTSVLIDSTVDYIIFTYSRFVNASLTPWRISLRM